MKQVFFIFFVVASFVVYPQEVIKGKIVDGKTGNPIPYANILIKNTHYGTISNEQGNFSLVIPNGKSFPVTLLVSSIGYKTKEVLIRRAGKVHDIELKQLPVILNDVEIKENKKPTTVKELMKNTWENYSENIIADTIQKTYFSRSYAMHDKFFFSEKSIVSTLDNNFNLSKIYAYDLKSSCGFIKENKKKLLSVGAWFLNWTLVDNGKYITEYTCKHYRKSFIDTVYMKDDHLIFVAVYSNKLDKQSYISLTGRIKLDPTWASLHFNDFDSVINNKIELAKLYIDKTDNYKVLKIEWMESGDIPMDLDILSISFSNVGNKMVLSHSWTYRRESNNDKSYYVDRYEEALLTNIDSNNVSVVDSSYKDMLDLLDELRGKKEQRGGCFPETTFGKWNSYNVIENDSLDNRVARDLEELKKKYEKK